MYRLAGFLRLIAPYWLPAVLSLSLGVLTVGSHIGLMTTSAYLISRAALHPPVLDLMVAIVGVRFFGIARAVFRYLERYVSHDVTFRILAQIRVTFYKAVEPLAPARLINFRSGDLLSRIVADVETLQYVFLRVLAPPLVALVVLLGYAVFLAHFDFKLSAVFVICFLLAGLGIPLMMKLLGRGIGQKTVAAKSELNTFVIDSIQGMTEILTYGQAPKQKERLADLSSTLRRLQRKTSILSGLSSALTALMMNLSMLLILTLSIQLVSNGELQGTYLAMLALGALSSFEAVLPLPLTFQYFEQSRAAAKRLDEITCVKSCIQEPINSSPKPRHYDLEITDLSFRYSSEEPWALKGVNLCLPEGGRIAIVGPSGAGKSTVVNLLLRFWEYDQGSIRLGGCELKDYAQEELRSLIGVVTQRTHLFNATIRENLLLAKPGATEQELANAASMAKLHDFIQTLPDGYDSYVGEGGFKLSGGQRQRIAIARVLLRNAPVLILDKATAGLDPVTERDVMQQIYELMEGRTTLVITHQLTALKGMDQIIVLDQGEIVERGRLL